MYLCESSKTSKIIKIDHECEGGMEKSVPRIADWHNEAFRVMTNGDHEGRNFLSHPHTNNGYLSFTPLNAAFSHLKKATRSSRICRDEACSQAHRGLTVGFLLLRYSFVYIVESLSLFYFLFISRFVFNRR